MSVSDQEFQKRIAALTPEQRRLLELRLQKQQAQPVEAVRPQAPQLIVRLAERGRYPLSFAQQRLWFLEQLEPGGSAYSLFEAVRLEGPLDIELLGRVFTEIVRRQESLRTRFAEEDGQEGGEAVQIVDPARPARPFAPRQVDLRALPVRQREPEALRRAAAEARVPFDLTRGDLLRVTLYRTDDEQHVMLLAVHHIVSDGWSMGVLVAEVTALYTAFAQGQPSPLPELPVQYGDFAVWQRGWLAGEVLDQQVGYWKRQLAGAPPVLELPTDRPRPAEQTFRGTRRPVVVSGELVRSLRLEGATPFMTLLAAFQAVLGRYTGTSDVVIGSPIANRRQSEVEKLIGFFVNTLVLRTDLNGDPPFLELVRRVRQVALGAFAHQDLPFEKLVDELRPERALSHSPLFQVLFNLQNAPAPKIELADLTLTPLDVEHAEVPFNLTLMLWEGAEGLTGWLEYSTDLFDASTMDRLVEHWRTFLTSGLADPGVPISDLPLLSGPERRQLLEEPNNTRVEHPRDTLIHELFAAQAARTPQAPAVSFGGQTLTYRELDERANRLAHHLRRLGVGPEALVGLRVERSERMVVGLLGILKSGGAYVPLDPSHPEERLAMVLEDAEVKVLVTDDFLDQEAIAAESAVAPVRWTDEESLAYVIYTSGSTGRPKGVQLPHRAVVNFLRSMAVRPGMTAGDVLPAVTTLSFNIAGLEIYLPLMVGGRIEVVSREETADGRRLAERMADSGATVMQATPATWRLLVESGWEGLPGLKGLCGGEALPRELAEALLVRGVELWNVYGPTETAIWSAAGEVLSEEAPVRLGQPLDNTRFYVVDRSFHLVPVGVPGELLIAGDGVARGYFKKADLTAEKFVADSFSGEPGARLYRTGDLVRWRRGELEFLGRIDHQVKVRGFRIELGEIEACLGRHPTIAQAVVTARGEGGEKRLAAYLVARQGEAVPGISELRAFLQETLPDYMVPAVFVVLDVLPLNPSGKVDRKALPEPNAAASAEYVAPRGATEERLAAIWAEVLRVERVGAEDVFFDLGGHSLLATRVMSRVRQAFSVDLPLRRLFEAPTVAGLARAIDQALGEGSEDAEIPPLVRLRRDRERLSFAQERLWFFERLHPGTATYNLASALRVAGALDVQALTRSVNEVVRRHESLRTTFDATGEETVQVVAPELVLGLPVTDLRPLPEDEREAAAEARARGEASRPFDLGKPGGSAAPRRAAAARRRRARPARHRPPHRQRRLVGRRADPGHGDAVRSLLPAADLAPSGAAGAVRRLCVLAAELAPRRGAGAPARLLARPSRRRAGRLRAARRPAAAGGPNLRGKRSRVHRPGRREPGPARPRPPRGGDSLDRPARPVPDPAAPVYRPGGPGGRLDHRRPRPP